ncbi:unnamed protein product, partial [Ectocarpus sp. 8 AP-2014]
RLPAQLDERWRRRGKQETREYLQERRWRRYRGSFSSSRRWCRRRTCSRDGPTDRVHDDAAPASSGGEPSALCGVVRACRPEQDRLVASPIGFGCKYRRVHRGSRHSSQNVHQPRILQDPRSGVDPRRAPGCSRKPGRLQPRRRRRSQQHQHALLHERAHPTE